MQSETTRMQDTICIHTWLRWSYAIARRWWTSETRSVPLRCPAGNCMLCKPSVLLQKTHWSRCQQKKRVTGLSHLKTRCPFWRPRLMKSLPLPCSPSSCKYRCLVHKGKRCGVTTDVDPMTNCLCLAVFIDFMRVLYCYSLLTHFTLLCWSGWGRRLKRNYHTATFCYSYKSLPTNCE